jgi:hypothetical protein
MGRHGMVGATDRLGEALRSEPGNFIEGEVRPGRNHQVIVGHFGSIVQNQPALIRLNLAGALGEESHTLPLHHRNEISRGVDRVPPTDGHPRVGGGKMAAATFADHRQPILGAELQHDFVGRQGSSKSGSENDGFCLDAAPSFFDRPGFPGGESSGHHTAGG